MNNARLYMAIALVHVALCYLVTIDWFVLTDNHLQWSDMGIVDLLYTTAPSILLLINAVVLLVCKDSPTVGESKYCGTKYGWMSHSS